METPRNSDNYDISIHALRKESDLIVNPNGTIRCAFQSTLSVRRATRVRWDSDSSCRNFNPRSP